MIEISTTPANRGAEKLIARDFSRKTTGFDPLRRSSSTHAFDDTCNVCRELIRFLGMAFWTDSFPPDAPSIQGFRHAAGAGRKKLRALSIALHPQ